MDTACNLYDTSISFSLIGIFKCLILNPKMIWSAVFWAYIWPIFYYYLFHSRIVLKNITITCLQLVRMWYGIIQYIFFLNLLENGSYGVWRIAWTIATLTNMYKELRKLILKWPKWESKLPKINLSVFFCGRHILWNTWVILSYFGSNSVKFLSYIAFRIAHL